MQAQAPPPACRPRHTPGRLRSSPRRWWRPLSPRRAAPSRRLTQPHPRHTPGGRRWAASCGGGGKGGVGRGRGESRALGTPPLRAAAWHALEPPPPGAAGQAGGQRASLEAGPAHLKASTLPTDTVHCAATMAQKGLDRAKSAHGTSDSRSSCAAGSACPCAWLGSPRAPAASAPEAAPAAGSEAAAPPGAAGGWSDTSGSQPSSQTKPREPKIQKTLSQPRCAMSSGHSR